MGKGPEIIGNQELHNMLLQAGEIRRRIEREISRDPLGVGESERFATDFATLKELDGKIDKILYSITPKNRP